MTITSNILRKDYTANGVNTTFAFDFPIFYESNATPKFSLEVIITDILGVETIKVETTDYTVNYNQTDYVNGVISQGNVVLNIAPTLNYKVSILRKLNFTQNNDITTSGSDALPGTALEGSLDKLTLISLQILENLNRVVRLPKSSQLTNIEFPINSSSANQILAINNDGNNLTTKDLADVSLAPVSSYIKTLLDDTTSSQARTTLDAQQLNPNLTALAGLTGANNKVPYFTGSGAMALRDLLATSTSQGILALTPNKTIYLSNNTTDATNDIDVTAGWFNFDDGSGQAYYSGGTGQLDVLFSAGGDGMLDASTIANTTYHIFLIYNPTTLLSKLLASTNVSSPTLPSGYTKKVRIGSIIRASGAILTFRQSDKQFIWTGTKIVDKAVGSIPTISTTQALTVPAGIAVDALSIFGFYYVSGSANTYLISREPSETDTTPSQTNFDILAYAGGYASSSSGILNTRTNTSSQIAIRASQTGVHTLGILAKGYIDYQLIY